MTRNANTSTPPSQAGKNTNLLSLLMYTVMTVMALTSMAYLKQRFIKLVGATCNHDDTKPIPNATIIQKAKCNNDCTYSEVQSGCYGILIDEPNGKDDSNTEALGTTVHDMESGKETDMMTTDFKTQLEFPMLDGTEATTVPVPMKDALMFPVFDDDPIAPQPVHDTISEVEFPDMECNAASKPNKTYAEMVRDGDLVFPM